MRRASSIMALVVLTLVGMIGGSYAQSDTASKGSATHIRAATGKVDGAAIQANARTSRDWLSYGLDYVELTAEQVEKIKAFIQGTADAVRPKN